MNSAETIHFYYPAVKTVKYTQLRLSDDGARAVEMREPGRGLAVIHTTYLVRAHVCECQNGKNRMINKTSPMHKIIQIPPDERKKELF